MVNKLIAWAKQRNIDKYENALFPTKDIKIEGIKFKIRKLNPLDYMSGAKAMAQMWTLYNSGNSESQSEANINKIREHYVDVFTSSVLQPVLSRKQNGEGLYVESLFNNIEIWKPLYESIMEFTYGKKKQMFLSYQKKS